MTSTTDLIKTDSRGRITVSRAHREALLEAFDQSTMSAQAFAQNHGVKYTTFANWLQRRRRAAEPPEAQAPRLTLAELTLAPETPARPLALVLPERMVTDIL
jgi:DNA-binding transcriptional regulator/RsmH inhibitor MraZ